MSHIKIALALLLIFCFPSLSFSFETVSVTSFGAKGNGKADDTESIQKALDFAFSNGQGRTVYFPAGSYKITQPLSIPRNVNILGEGIGFASAIYQYGNVGIMIDGMNCEGGYAFRNKIQGITLILSQAKTNSTAIQINNAYTIKLEDIFIYEAPGTGIKISNSKHLNLSDVSVYGSSNKKGTGILISDSVVNIYNLDIENFLYGMRIGPDKKSGAQVSVFGGFIERFGNTGLIVDESESNTFIGLNILSDNKTKHPIQLLLKNTKKNKNTFIGGNAHLANNKELKNIKIEGETDNTIWLNVK